jgi:hypothetical protein
MCLSVSVPDPRRGARAEVDRDRVRCAAHIVRVVGTRDTVDGVVAGADVDPVRVGVAGERVAVVRSVDVVACDDAIEPFTVSGARTQIHHDRGRRARVVHGAVAIAVDAVVAEPTTIVAVASATARERVVAAPPVMYR